MRLNPIRIEDDGLGNNMENECPSCGNDPWPKPSLAVDAIVTRKNGEEILLIRRGRNPWKGAWAFPGGFVDVDEEICKAAGCSIEDIFEKYGEVAFRDVEERVMARLLNEKNQVFL